MSGRFLSLAPPSHRQARAARLRVAARLLGALALLLAVTGCVSHRLDGPLYRAEDPPWIAEGAQAAVLPLDRVEQRLVLIGDAGLWLEDDPTLAALGRWTRDVPSTVLFLGDNLYNEGLVDDDRKRGERILRQQLEATAATKIFVPGNHDWGFSPAKQNVEAIRNQQAFVDGWPDGSAAFLPKEGCMGPVRRRISPPGVQRALSLILLDPTPWIQPRLRAACPEETSHERHLAALDEMLMRSDGDWVVVASHYPLLTGGPHGGLTYGRLADAVIGVLGWCWGGLMNTYEPRYADWIEQTSAVLRRHPPLVHAAGHDHNLQVLRAGDMAGAFVVSGAGAPARVSTVTNLPESLFAHAHPGFVVIDLGARADRPTAVLRVVENGHPEPVFEMELRTP